MNPLELLGLRFIMAVVGVFVLVRAVHVHHDVQLAVFGGVLVAVAVKGAKLLPEPVLPGDADAEQALEEGA